MKYPGFLIRVCALALAAPALIIMPAAADDRDQDRIRSHHDDLQHQMNQCRALGEKGDNKSDNEDLNRLCLAILRQNQSFTLQDQEHLSVILDYAGKHPDLKAHLMTLLADPQPGDAVQAIGDGNWQIKVPVTIPCVPGAVLTANCNPQTTTETVTTSGVSAKLSGLYRSVIFDSDRRQQLRLYMEAYNRLPQEFMLSGNAVLPTPDSLSNVPLTAIQNALKSLGNAWQAIIPNLPLPRVPPSTASCDGEVGTTPQHANYGDRVGNSSSCTPSSTGLFSSLSDQSFPARQYLTCVKEQGNRETCHTFAGTSAVELMISQSNGMKVNLSEQDLMEHYRLLWSPGYLHETGDAYEELSGAIANNYFFAYENQWDYNPSYSRTFNTGTGLYVNSCANYPGTEPGCSETAPQAPGVCLSFQIPFFGPIPVCALHDAGVASSPWQATSLSSFWNAGDTELSKEYMILSLAFHNAVVFGFNVTNSFYAGGNGGYVVYDATDVTTNVGGHYVHVVGLATNDELPKGAPQATGGGYFIVKNSWSNCFGDAGYLYLDWDYVKAVGWAAFNVSTN